MFSPVFYLWLFADFCSFRKGSIRERNNVTIKDNVSQKFPVGKEQLLLHVNRATMSWELRTYKIVENVKVFKKEYVKYND